MEIKVLGPGCANCKRLYAGGGEGHRPGRPAGDPHQGGGDRGDRGLRHPEDAGARDRREGRGLGPDPRRGGDRHHDHDRGGEGLAGRGAPSRPAPRRGRRGRAGAAPRDGRGCGRGGAAGNRRGGCRRGRPCTPGQPPRRRTGRRGRRRARGRDASSVPRRCPRPARASAAGLGAVGPAGRSPAAPASRQAYGSAAARRPRGGRRAPAAAGRSRRAPRAAPPGSRPGIWRVARLGDPRPVSIWCTVVGERPLFSASLRMENRRRRRSSRSRRARVRESGSVTTANCSSARRGARAVAAHDARPPSVDLAPAASWCAPAGAYTGLSSPVDTPFGRVGRPRAARPKGRTVVHALEIRSGTVAGADVPPGDRPRAGSVAIAPTHDAGDRGLLSPAAGAADHGRARLAPRARTRLRRRRPRSMDADGVPRAPLRAARRLPPGQAGPASSCTACSTPPTRTTTRSPGTATTSTATSTRFFVAVWLVPLSFLAPPYTASVAVAALFAGYTAEEWAHHAMHFDNFRWRYFQYVRRRHLYHHSRLGVGTAYGITSDFWDKVFGTRIPAAAARSAGPAVRAGGPRRRPRRSPHERAPGARHRRELRARPRDGAAAGRPGVSRRGHGPARAGARRDGPARRGRRGRVPAARGERVRDRGRGAPRRGDPGALGRPRLARPQRGHRRRRRRPPLQRRALPRGVRHERRGRRQLAGGGAARNDRGGPRDRGRDLEPRRLARPARRRGLLGEQGGARDAARVHPGRPPRDRRARGHRLPRIHPQPRRPGRTRTGASRSCSTSRTACGASWTASRAAGRSCTSPGRCRCRCGTSSVTCPRRCSTG